jgi:steroid delta-isomerase-like uncharacterized protein
MTTTATEQTTEAINDAANRRLADEVWSQGNLDLCEELVAPDWVLHQPSAPDPGRGPAGYRAWVAANRAAFPDFRLVAEEQFCLGDRVATRWTMRGTHLGALRGVAPTGRALEWTGITIKRFAGGKVAETWVCSDTLAVLQQLGAAPGDAGPRGW